MAVNRSQIADEIVDVIKGTRQLWDDSPADVRSVWCSAEKYFKLLHKTLAQLSDTLTYHKKAVRHPQNCLATIERRARFQKAAVGTPFDGHAFIVCTTK